jgi:hypothetical protein
LKLTATTTIPTEVPHGFPTLQAKSRKISDIGSWPFPATYFPVHYLLNILLVDTIQSVTDTVNKNAINKSIYYTVHWGFFFGSVIQYFYSPILLILVQKLQPEISTKTR